MKKLFFQIILPLVAIAGILGVITLLNPIQQQNAAVSDGTLVKSCGPITIQIDTTSNPSCGGDGGINGLSNFSASAHFKVISGSGAYGVHWTWGEYFCPTEDPHAPCMNAVGSTSNVGGITGNGSGQFTATANTVSHPGWDHACGYYQDDLAFYVTDNSTGNIVCSYGNMSNPGQFAEVAAWCHSNLTCQNTQPTSTPVPPTSTPVPPTSTPIPPTSTPVPPTSTPVPGATVTPTNTPSPTLIPTATPTGTNTNNCGNNNQSGNNDNNNCNNNNNQNNNNNNNQQQQQQTQNNNQTVNITLGNNGQQQQQQQVLAAATTPTQLPSTGAEGEIVFGLLALIPVGWKIRKLI